MKPRNTDIGCTIAQDLMPLYAEDLLHPESREALEAHCQACKVCAGRLEEIQKPLSQHSDKFSSKTADQNALDCMKKIRQHNRKKNRILWISGIAGLILGFLLFESTLHSLQVPAVYLRSLVDSETDPSSITITSLAPSDVFAGSGSRPSIYWTNEQESASPDDPGKTDLNIRVFGGSLFPGASSETVALDPDDLPASISVNGRLVWQDGIQISDQAAELFALKDGYAGDASRAGHLLEILGVPAKLKMDTEDENSVSWTLFLNTEQSRRILYSASLDELELQAHGWSKEQILLYQNAADEEAKTKMLKEQVQRELITQAERSAFVLLYLTPNLQEVRIDLGSDPETSDQVEAIMTRNDLDVLLKNTGLPQTPLQVSDVQKLLKACQI